MGIKLIKKTNESRESDLENIAQTSGEIEYADAWKLNRSAAKEPELRKKVRNLIGDWRSAAEDEDDDGMTKAAKALKALADSLPKQEARMHLGRCKEAVYTSIKEPEQAAFIIDCGSPEKAKELNDAFYEVAYVNDGWKPNKEVIGGELIQCWNVGPFFTACVDPCDKAAAWCEEWLRNSGGAAPAIQGNDAGLENEDRRGTDRYGHHVKRFTAKDLKDLDGEVIGGNGDDAGADGKFGLADLDTTSISAFTNNFSPGARDGFLHDLAQMPISKKSIEDMLRKHQLHKYGRTVGVRDFFPENGVAYLGTIGDDGLPRKSLVLRWGPALKK